MGPSRRPDDRPQGRYAGEKKRPAFQKDAAFHKGAHSDRDARFGKKPAPYRSGKGRRDPDKRKRQKQAANALYAR